MKTRSDFSQFTATPVNYSTAMKLARQATGRNGITVMTEMRKNHYNELLLPTGAKLKYDPQSEEFSIFSYSADGRDGWEAYSMAHVRTDECKNCGAQDHLQIYKVVRYSADIDEWGIFIQDTLVSHTTISTLCPECRRHMQQPCSDGWAVGHSNCQHLELVGG